MSPKAIGIALSPSASKPLYNQWYAELVNDDDDAKALKGTYHPIQKVIRVKSGKGLILETPLFSAFAWNHSSLSDFFLGLCSNMAEVGELYIEPIDDTNFTIAQDDDVIGSFVVTKPNIFSFERKLTVKPVKKPKMPNPTQGDEETF